MSGLYAVMDALLPFGFLSFQFMKNALLAILLLTPLLALLGTMAVNQRMAFFSDALGHSALTGIGLGILLSLGNDLVAMLLFGVIWALLISRIKQTGTTSADTVISVFSSTSIALGLVILSRGGGFAKYSSLLIGDVLAVTPQDLLWLLLALILGVVFWMLIYNRLLLTSINPALARSRGVKTRFVEYAFVLLVAVAVMLSIRWVGVLLINALLILPAAAGRNLARSAKGHAAFSILIAMTSGVCGLILAFYLDTSAGAAIVLCAAAWYALSHLALAIRNSRDRKKA
jgi:zinc transport system permease protein